MRKVSKGRVKSYVTAGRRFSLLKGIARIGDFTREFSAREYERILRFDTDQDALASDWNQVGAYLYDALDRFERDRKAS